MRIFLGLVILVNHFAFTDSDELWQLLAQFLAPVLAQRDW